MRNYNPERQSSRKENPEQIDKSKRNFVVGGLALSGATIAGMVKVGLNNKENSDLPDEEPLSFDEVNEDKIFNSSVSEYDEKSHSGYFNYDVEFFRKQFERDMPVIMDRIEVLKAIKKHFVLPGIDLPRVRHDLENLILGIAVNESRLDVNAVSEKGAFSSLQIIPSVWEELAKEGESKDSLIDTIKVSARLMEQSYRHITSTCSKELSQIQEKFFDNNADAFQDYFLIPLLANSYNAGMGTMAMLLKWFVQRFPDASSTVEVFEQSETLTGYDVFFALAHTANNEQQVGWYKDKATNYTCKSYAAFYVLYDYLMKDKS